MKISRSGSTAFHGTRSIELFDPKVEWDDHTKSIVLKKNRIKDFSNGSKHDYEIFISLEELASLIRVVGEEPINDSPDDIAQSLSPNLRQLHRLVNACIGNFGAQATTTVS